MSRMSIDQNAIRQSVYAYANNLAALAESSSGKLPPFLVTLGEHHTQARRRARVSQGSGGVGVV